MSDKVIMSRLPSCNIRGCRNSARYDARTRSGRWGFLCKGHFARYGVGVGLGLGQFLLLPHEVQETRETCLHLHRNPADLRPCGECDYERWAENHASPDPS